MTPKRDKVPGWISPEKLAFYPEKYWQQLYEKLQQHRPSTGAMVIDLVCNYIKPETLRITGFDFKATHTLFEKKEHLGLHDWALEQDFTLSLMATAKEEGRDWLIV